MRENGSNRLIKEKSPYLLQHAYNPVDWYPWGEEAFKKAIKEDKPIFLSIGYSTCHWCHVMEEESFTSLEIADILNKYFVSIKVDREERPDLDNIYMKAVQAMTGAGGWPMTIFLTPDKKPFYGGTYFPQKGLKDMLLEIAGAWEKRRGELVNSGKEITEVIFQERKPEEPRSLDAEVLKKAYLQLNSNFDSRHGGFGRAPKFPTSHSLCFLLRYWKRTGEKDALEIAEKTLSSMARGGIYDHLGGGFHRYSVDREWRIPHFEKMLYDQAINTRAYLELYQATGNIEYADIVKETFEFIIRDMTHPGGGFYSGLDADSGLPEDPSRKEEGAFYLWTKDEVTVILGKEDAEPFCRYYGIGDTKSVLYLAHPPKEDLTRLREKLFKARLERPRLHLDNKVLTDWNGLMISSLAFGSRVLNEPRYSEAAEKAAQFILKNGPSLPHFSAIPGMIDDYAFFIHGLIDLYEATFNPEYLEEAKRLAKEMIRLFWDKENGGFFFTASDSEILITRQKEIYDGALPSGNSVAVLDLIRLSRLTMDKEFKEKANSILKTFSSEISQMPTAYTQMLIALDFVLGPSVEIVIEGKDTANVIKTIYKGFIPNKTVGSRSGKEGLAVYICENNVCKPPVGSVEELDKLLYK